MLGPDQFPEVNDFQNRQFLLHLDKVIPSDPTLLDDAVKEITAALDCTACWDDADIIGLVVQEALANAIVHGNHCDPETMVRICVAVNENCDLLVTVKDSGSGFDPSGLPNPLASENLLARTAGAYSLCDSSWTRLTSSSTTAQRFTCAEGKSGLSSDRRVLRGCTFSTHSHRPVYFPGLRALSAGSSRIPTRAAAPKAAYIR
jgi:hypothetical protein